MAGRPEKRNRLAARHAMPQMPCPNGVQALLRPLTWSIVHDSPQDDVAGVICGAACQWQGPQSLLSQSMCIAGQ